MFLLLLLLFITPVYPQNTCSINALSPATTCVYCALAGSVTIGANTTTSSPTQVLNVGLYSATHNYGKQVATPTAQTINAWTQSNTVNIVTGNTPTVYIGTNSPVTPAPSQAQEVYLFQYSRNVRLGENSVGSVLVGTNAGVTSISTGPTAGPVSIGKTTPTPTPQSVTIAQYSTGVTLGNDVTGDIFIGRLNTGVVYIGRVDHTTASNIIVIGQNNAPPSPTPAPVQTVYVGRYSASVQIGEYTPSLKIGVNMPASSLMFIGREGATTDATTVIVGRYTSNLLLGTDAPHSPTWPGQTVNIGPYTSSILIGWQQASSSAITIGYTSPAGAATLTTSSKMNFKGLYHHQFSATCGAFTPSPGTASPTVSPTRYTGQIQCNSNVRSTITPSSSPTVPPTGGYNTLLGQYFIPEPGWYEITASSKTSNALVYGVIRIRARVDGAALAVMAASQTDNTASTGNAVYASTIINFSTAPSATSYIQFDGDNIDLTTAEFNVVTVKRTG